MPSLRVLSLKENAYLKELPSGISILVSLQHLDLSQTAISELPLELKALMNLRYLNLEQTYRLSIIPQQLISGFSKLNILKLLWCGDLDSIVEEGNVLSEDAEFLIKELLCLEHLNLISLTLNSSRAVQNFLKSPKLLRITRSLSIRNCESRPLINVLLLTSTEHLKELQIQSNLEELKIECTGEIEKVVQSGFRSVHSVTIRYCTVKDLTWLAFAPNLMRLVLDLYFYMEEIISVEKLSDVSGMMGENEASEIMGELNLFAQLESLNLVGLVELKSIYANPLPFPQLKNIRVLGCRKLKKLPLKSSSANEHQIVIEGEKEWWEELQWVDEATQNAFSTCFVPHA